MPHGSRLWTGQKGRQMVQKANQWYNVRVNHRDVIGSRCKEGRAARRVVMTCRVVGSICAILMLWAAGCAGALAQTPPELQPSPIIEDMLRKSPEGGQIVEFRGYIGPSSTPDVVRLYQSLGLARYYEIPRSAIINAIRDEDPKTGAVKVYVRGSATIVIASKVPAAVAAFASARASNLGAFASARASNLGAFGLAREAPGGCAAVCAACALALLTGQGGAALENCTFCGVCESL
jgi:hypothetical protein